MAQETKEKVGPVSILVNNAGIVSGTALLDTSDEKIIRTFDVNIMAHFWTIKAFLPDMISKRQVPGCVLQTVTVYLNSFLISSRASNPIMIKISGPSSECCESGGAQRHPQAGRLLRLQVRRSRSGRGPQGGAFCPGSL